jgi:DNA-binding LytR/AlgR family response regulator
LPEIDRRRSQDGVCRSRRGCTARGENAPLAAKTHLLSEGRPRGNQGAAAEITARKGNEMKAIDDRVWLHVGESRRRVIDPADVFWLEADGDDTWVRFRGARRVRDSRKLVKVAKVFERFGFVRVHRNHAVNGRRVREVRKRRGSREWEVRLQPPVNRVLPVSRAFLPALKKAYGER